MGKPSARRVRIGAAAVLIVALCAWGFLEFEPLRHRELTYEAPPTCPGGHGAWGRDTYLASWEGAMLLIHATEYPNCAEEVERVSAHVIDDLVILRIRYYSPSGDTYACDCQKVTVVRLAGLEKRDYRVSRISLYPWQ